MGDETADWLFVGEGPGAEEDARGEPFVGQAGKLLDNMLAAIGLQRGRNVYIANVVKCRPPGNRNPEPPEAAACEPYLTRQIALIRPKLVIALGRVAAVNLLARDATIASLRGRLHDYQGIPLVVTYHPAYLLRNLPDKAKAWQDLCFARAAMARLQRGGVTDVQLGFGLDRHELADRRVQVLRLHGDGFADALRRDHPLARGCRQPGVAESGRDPRQARRPIPSSIRSAWVRSASTGRSCPRCRSSFSAAA